MKKFTKPRYLLIQALIIYVLYLYVAEFYSHKPTYPTHLLYPTADQFLNNSCSKDPTIDQFKYVKMNSAASYIDIITECSKISRETQSSCRVPNVVHLIPGSKFKYYHYIAIKAIKDIIKPYKIYMHGEVFPVNNKLFMKTIRDYDIELVTSRTVNEVFGREMFMGEHKADILRMEALIRFGGIYLDMDAFVIRPFDRFMDDELSIGYQNKDENYGINNGIMIAKRCSRFLLRWYEEYRFFNHTQWDESSVRVPLRLYEQDNSHVKVYERELLSWWSFEGNPFIMPMFKPYQKEEWVDVHAVHSFYRLFAGNIPQDYDFETVKELDNSFGRYARNILYGGPPL